MSPTKKLTHSIPNKPGVYQFKDNSGLLLYIGKATSLKNRVASYFHKSNQLTPQKQLLVKKIKKLEFIITSTPTEALLLESNLIKKHQPPFNIDLKDDKNFQYIKITVMEDFPRVFTVRRILNDKAKYFGPFVSGISVRQTLKLLRKLFPHHNFPKPVSKHYLELMLKRYPQLLGPADKTEYQHTIKQIINFLKGHYEDIVKDLKIKMKLTSDKRQYEKAATYRDIIQSIERIMEKQIVVSSQLVNQDIISLAHNQELAAVNLFIIRRGKLMNKQNFILKNTSDKKDPEIIQAFIERYYTQATNLPREIIVPSPIDLKGIIEKTFKIKVIVPQKGNKRKYLNLGEKNAISYLEQQQASWQKSEAQIKQALVVLKKKLKLPAIPQRIEIFDISNIQGQNAVGSMVVFTNGLPDKKWYRKFKIKTVSGANDTAMMAEVIQRRFKHAPSPLRGEGKGERDWPRPDLVILDGGKGQLSAARRQMPAQIPTAALAKKNEDIYLPQTKNPVTLPINSPSFHLIQHMRDEAHRFAITFYRQKHQRAALQSPLDEIPRLGKSGKKKLLAHFGSVDNIKDSSLTELQKIIGPSLAKKLRNYYNPVRDLHT